ncbi:hypothetical protein DV737_g5562, partial [Chaetothyriales sp. CBS 132003]
MADYAAGSRAIKIPLHPSAISTGTYDTPPRRQRGSSRRLKSFPTADLLERGGGGPSSSASSEAESPMSSHSAAYRPQASIASPSDKDPRLPDGKDSGGGGGGINASQLKGKGKATPATTPPASPSSNVFQASSPLGPSMLASSSYKSINLNAHNDDPDEPPRLITYTKHSQGFIWNDELFLPSYLIGRFGGRKKQYDSDFGNDDDEEEACQVAEIFVTDEEVAAMGIS